MTRTEFKSNVITEIPTTRDQLVQRLTDGTYAGSVLTADAAKQIRQLFCQLSEDLATARIACFDLNDVLTATRKAVSELRKDRDQLEADKNQLVKRLKSLEDTLTDVRAIVYRDANTIGNLTKQLAEVTAQRNELDAKVTDMLDDPPSIFD